MEKSIVLNIGKEKFEAGRYEDVMKVCEEIRSAAGKKLEKIITESKDGVKIEESVAEFLKKSIEKIIGDGAVLKIFGDRVPEIPELTEVLCNIISEVGTVISEDSEGAEDEA